MSLFPRLPEAASAYEEEFNAQFQNIENCISSEKDMKLVRVALSAIIEDIEDTKALPEKFADKINTLRESYKCQTLSEEERTRFQTIFKANLQEAITCLENKPLDSLLSCMESNITDKDILLKIKKLSLVKQISILSAFHVLSTKSPASQKNLLIYLTEIAMKCDKDTFKALIKLFIEKQDLPITISKIRQFFPNSKDSNIVIAHFINIQEVPLSTLLNQDICTRDQLLELAPNLRFVDLEGIDEAGAPDFLIELIKKSPNLIYLKIRNKKIRSLPNLSNCQTLDCSCCRELRALPPLPNCQEIKCIACIFLRALPELPNCQTLNCTSCTTLTALPELPNCQKLNCSCCRKLRALPELPNCQTLNCNGCTTLTALPELPNCQILECPCCYALLTLPELPNCQKLNCSHCTALTALPEELPNCQELNFRDCPLLQSALPELRYEASIHSATTFQKLEVDIDLLSRNPKHFLLMLGDNYLLQNKPFPNVYYFSNGQYSPAVDVGGVRRDFVTKLFERLFLKKDELNTQLPFIQDTSDSMIWPTISEDSTSKEELEKCYRIIGKLFNLCYLNTCNLKTGSLFSPDLFKVLKVIDSSDDAAIRSLLILKGFPENVLELTLKQNPSSTFEEKELENLKYLLDPVWSKGDEIPNFSKRETRLALREKLLKEAKQDGRLHAAFCIASAMQESLGPEKWAIFCSTDSSVLDAKIQGELSADALKQKLKWECSQGVNPEDLAKTKAFLENWIDTYKEDLDKLKLFVRAITGNTSLGSYDLKIQIFPRGEAYLPVTHTCFFSLETSSDYPSQEVFNEKLELLLTEGLAGEGFQEN